MPTLQSIAAACRRFLRTPRPSAMCGVFSDIYEKNIWGNEESRSGPGSTVSRTAALRPQIIQLLQELGIQTLLDAPCGDFQWLKEAALPVRRYIGVDVVPELIQRNRQIHASAQREFLQLDITADPLPQADLILCRDCLVHLCFADIWRALDRFRQSGAAYLLTTTFHRQSRNEDIKTGGWRPLNMEVSPFSFPPVLRQLDDSAPIRKYRDKGLGLWRIG